MKRILLLVILSLSVAACSETDPSKSWTSDPLEAQLYQAGIEYVEQKIYPGDVREYNQHHLVFSDSIYVMKLTGTYYDKGLHSFNVQMKAHQEKGQWVPVVTEWVQADQRR